jgi:adenine/guanine phosphoribosyltransferase-like PRPP-binding protein
MLDVKYLHPCFCIGTYVPKRFWDDENIPDDGYTAFILDIKYGESEAIRECIDLLSYNLTGFNAVTAVPPSQVGATSGIQRVARELAQKKRLTDATSCLRRHKSVASHAENSHRSVDEHLKSIFLEHPEKIEGKRILLLDDVRTTGCSIDACSQLLEQASPQLIISIALAQTCGIDDERFYYRYGEALVEVRTDYDNQKEVLDVHCELEEKALERLEHFAG